MTLWKNEDWEQLKLVRERQANRKKGQAEEVVSPWAGKNPIAAFKVGATPVKGEWAFAGCERGGLRGCESMH